MLYVKVTSHSKVNKKCTCIDLLFTSSKPHYHKAGGVDWIFVKLGSLPRYGFVGGPGLNKHTVTVTK